MGISLVGGVSNPDPSVGGNSDSRLFGATPAGEVSQPHPPFVVGKPFMVSRSPNPRHPCNPRQSAICGVLDQMRRAFRQFPQSHKSLNHNNHSTDSQSCKSHKSCKSCFRLLPKSCPSHPDMPQQPVPAPPDKIPPQGYHRSPPSPSHPSDTPR